LKANPKIERTKKLKTILRDTGFVMRANLQTQLMTAYAVNASKTLFMPPRRLISHPRSRHPKKKKLILKIKEENWL
jgi:hypothetical protein